MRTRRRFFTSRMMPTRFLAALYDSPPRRDPPFFQLRLFSPAVTFSRQLLFASDDGRLRCGRAFQPQLGRSLHIAASQPRSQPHSVRDVPIFSSSERQVLTCAFCSRRVFAASRLFFADAPFAAFAEAKDARLSRSRCRELLRAEGERPALI